MSNSSNTQVRIAKEVTFNTTPAVAFDNINVTSETLSTNTSTSNSEFIRADGNIAGVIRTGQGIGGDLNTELQFSDEQDDLLEILMRNTFDADVNMAEITIAAVATDTFTDSGSGFVAAGIVAGQFIRVGGFVASNNNGVFKVLTVVAGTITVDSAAITGEVAGPSVTIKGGLLENGVTEQSMIVEVENVDIGEFQLFNGVRVGSMAMSMTPGGIITQTFGTQGIKETAAQATASTGAAVAADTSPSMNSVDNISLITEGGTLSTLDFTRLDLNISIALRDQGAIGNLNMVGIGTGTINVSGTLEAYLEDATLYDKYLAFTDSSLSFLVQDSDGNGYAYDIPKLNFTSGERTIPGIDQDVLLTLGFQGKLDAGGALGQTIGITRLPA